MTPLKTGTMRPPADIAEAGATWVFQVATDPVGKADHIVRAGGRACHVCGQPRGFPRLALKAHSKAFERSVARLIASTLPVLGDAMLAVDVCSYKQRPKELITRNRPKGPIPCPKKPDASNVLKSVEDALMRCRVCGGSKKGCKGVGHDYAPTLIDDATIVDTRCRTFYTAVLDVAAKLARPARIVVTVTVLEPPTAEAETVVQQSLL